MIPTNAVTHVTQKDSKCYILSCTKLAVQRKQNNLKKDHAFLADIEL